MYNITFTGIYIICRTNCRTSGQSLFIRPVEKHGSHVPVTRGALETYFARLPVERSVRKQRSNRIADTILRLVPQEGEELERFFRAFLSPLDGGPSCNGTHESRIAAALEGCKASEIFSSSSRASISSLSAYLKTRSTLQPRCPGARGT